MPAGSGIEKLANLSGNESENLWRQFQYISDYGDFMVIDLAAGISELTVSFMLAADAPLIVTTPSTTAFVDAYALIKVLAGRDPSCMALLFVNQYREEKDRSEVTEKIRQVAKRFLDMDIQAVGAMQNDWRVEKALNTQLPFVLQFPNAKITKAMHGLCAYFISQVRKSTNFGSRIKSLFGQIGQD